jgi:hypothetical protein
MLQEIAGIVLGRYGRMTGRSVQGCRFLAARQGGAPSGRTRSPNGIRIRLETTINNKQLSGIKALVPK